MSDEITCNYLKLIMQIKIDCWENLMSKINYSGFGKFKTNIQCISDIIVIGAYDIHF